MKKFSLNTMRVYIINAAIFLTVLLGIENILYVLYFPKRELMSVIGTRYGYFVSETLSIHRSFSVIIGIVLILISYNLYKRMRMAWIISLAMLLASTLIHVFKYHDSFQIVNFIEMFVIFILAVNYKDFKRSTDPISLKKAIKLSGIILIFIVFNVFFTMRILHRGILSTSEFKEAFITTFKIIFFFDPSLLGHMRIIEVIYIKSAIAINWTGIIFVLLLILKPLVYQPIVTAFDRERIRKLLKLYGENPTSYVSVENDKKYYFSKEVEGAVVYVVTAGVAVCVGDPICSDEDMPLLTTEFLTYCRQNNLDICFCQTIDKHLPLYTELGFGSTKYGEEAMFDLETYNLKGGKAAKIRNAINHATALGIYVVEYCPLKSRDNHLEQQITEISNEWLKNKKSGELSFMLGTVSLDNPRDRRYFAAFDSSNEMLGFIVFSPFLGGKGYFADVTRRKAKAPIGVMEKITIEAFRIMKTEGVKWGSLGLAPLANVSAEGNVTGKLLEIIYEKFNSFYGFKKLHHYKKKYGPTSWESRYLVYHPKIFTPKIAYSIIKAQNPKGVTDFLLSQLRNLQKGNERKDRVNE